LIEKWGTFSFSSWENENVSDYVNPNTIMFPISRLLNQHGIICKSPAMQEVK